MAAVDSGLSRLPEHRTFGYDLIHDAIPSRVPCNCQVSPRTPGGSVLLKDRPPPLLEQFLPRPCPIAKKRFPPTQILLMNHREPRLYHYDSQQAAWASSQIATHSLDYMANGYQYDTSNQYYSSASQEIGNMSDMASSSGPYFRSMTPSLIPGYRYPHASRERYLPSQDFVAPTSPLSPTMYTQHSVHYPSHCLPILDQNTAPLSQTTQQTRFIPTPSQIAHAYSTYSPQINNPPLQGDIYDTSLIEYSSGPNMLPSNTIQRRPSRTLTGRPRGGSLAGSASPTTASSPSGERFPCEKCGKTFSRSHDRKRHYETQHLPSPIIHRCIYCHKEFSRADSLKRHLDNGCDEMRS